MSIKLGLYKFEEPLYDIDPDCSYEDWIRVGRAIYHAANDYDYGLAVFNNWSSQCKKYKGLKEIKAIWDSFSTGEKDPYPTGTLVTMAAEARGIEPVYYVQMLQESMMRSYASQFHFYESNMYDDNE
jgi:hypothetical protein